MLKYFPNLTVFYQQYPSANINDTGYVISADSSEIIGTPGIPWDSICFIETEKLIWTHGKFFAEPNEITEETIRNWGFSKTNGTLTGVSFNGSNVPSENGIASITANIPAEVTENTVSGWGFTKNAGTVTGVTMNGASKGTSGVVDLGNVLTSFTEEDPTVATYIKNILESDITNWNSVSSKESNSNKVTSISASSTDTQYPSAKAVQNKINSLDGSASIASVSNDVVTIKTGVSEADGIISNDTGTDIVLAKVAKTGSPSDITVQYNNENVSLQTALANIKTDINTAASTGTQYIVSSNSSNTPSSAGGSLAASATTSGKVYLVPNGTDSYEQWITTQSGSTYSWTSLGSTTMDLNGVAKIITLNGKQYAVGEGTTLVDLGTVVTSVTGQTSISNGNTEYVHTVVNTTNDSNTGANVSSLETQVKIGNVSTGTTGLATATDVKTNLDNKIIIRTWSNS